MAFNHEVLALVDQRVKAALERMDARDTAAGDCVERTTDTSAMVRFDASDVAVPVKLAGGVDARAEDRVVMARAGVEWVIVASFTFREGPQYVAYGERATSSNTTTTEVRVLRLDNIALTNGKWYELVIPSVICDSTVNTDDVGIRMRARFDGGLATVSSGIVGGALAKCTNNAGQHVTSCINLYHCEADGEVLSLLMTCYRAAGTGSARITSITGHPIRMFVKEAGVMPANTGVTVN